MRRSSSGIISRPHPLSPNGFRFAEDQPAIQLVWGYRDQIRGLAN